MAGKRSRHPCRVRKKPVRERPRRSSNITSIRSCACSTSIVMYMTRVLLLLYWRRQRRILRREPTLTHTAVSSCHAFLRTSYLIGGFSTNCSGWDKMVRSHAVFSCNGADLLFSRERNAPVRHIYINRSTVTLTVLPCSLHLAPSSTIAHTTQLIDRLCTQCIPLHAITVVSGRSHLNFCAFHHKNL